jgi:hypothetical protein
MDQFDGLCPKEHHKDYKRAWNQVEKEKLVPNIDYGDDLTVLVENVSNMKDFFEVLRVKGPKISLNINVKKTKLH